MLLCASQQALQQLGAVSVDVRRNASCAASCVKQASREAVMPAALRSRDVRVHPRDDVIGEG